MKRRFDPEIPELMDQKQEADAELLEDLRNLETLNASFGAHRLVLQHFRKRLHAGKSWHLVDLATGYADIPRKLVLWCRKRSIPVRITAIDANAATLALAAKACRDFPEIEFVQGDILAWSPEVPPDAVMCNLALHHFSEPDAVQILKNCRNSGAKFLLVSDLRRGLFLNYGVNWITTFWLRARMTRHDAMLSAERAFSKAEMAGMLADAGWEGCGHKTVEFVRQIAWLDQKIFD